MCCYGKYILRELLVIQLSQLLVIQLSQRLVI